MEITRKHPGLPQRPRSTAEKTDATQQSRGERGEKEMCEGPEAGAGNRRGTSATKSG